MPHVPDSHSIIICCQILKEHQQGWFDVAHVALSDVSGLFLAIMVCVEVGHEYIYVYVSKSPRILHVAQL